RELESICSNCFGFDSLGGRRISWSATVNVGMEFRAAALRMFDAVAVDYPLNTSDYCHIWTGPADRRDAFYSSALENCDLPAHRPDDAASASSGLYLFDRFHRRSLVVERRGDTFNSK